MKSVKTYPKKFVQFDLFRKVNKTFHFEYIFQKRPNSTIFLSRILFDQSNRNDRIHVLRILENIFQLKTWLYVKIYVNECTSYLKWVSSRPKLWVFLQVQVFTSPGGDPNHIYTYTSQSWLVFVWIWFFVFQFYPLDKTDSFYTNELGCFSLFQWYKISLL